MPQRRLSIAGWILLIFGIMQVSVGILGVFSPATQFAMLGLEMVTGRQPSDHTEGLLSVVSLSAINTGLVYIFGAVRGWSWFPFYTIVARTVMGSGILALIAQGKIPSAFAGGAYFEFVGAAIILAALWWGGRTAAAREQ